MNVMHLYSHIAPVLMVVLIVVFGLIAGWAYWPKHKSRFDKDSHIPLRDGD